MLSPAAYHTQVPREFEANLKYRRSLIRLAETNDKWRAAILAACKRDILFWINTLIWQRNPQKFDDEVGPFITWPRQDEVIRRLVDCIEQGIEVPIEKSREVGMSWVVLIVFDWVCRFHNDKSFIVISHSEEAVDKIDDPKSLMWKLAFLNSQIPNWAPKFEKKKLNITYPKTRCVITGAANTIRAGVGDRATGIMLDEFAKQPNAGVILSDTTDTARCRVIVSTHYGTGTEFYKLVKDCPRDRKLVVHWSDDPAKRQGLYYFDPAKRDIVILDKTYKFPAEYQFTREVLPAGGPRPGWRSVWYDDQCRRFGRTKRDIAMHLDIDPHGSADQVFDPVKINDLRKEFCLPPVWIGHVLYDKDTGAFAGLQKSPGGPLSLWFNPESFHNGPPRKQADRWMEYFAGADISLGVGKTPSCIGFMNNLGRKVAQYVNRDIYPHEFAPLSVALCNFFSSRDGRGAELAYEANGAGGAVYAKKIKELGYRNLFMYKKRQGHLYSEETTDKPGWWSTVVSKELLITNYSAALEARLFINPADDAMAETLEFQRTARGVEHAADLAEKSYSAKGDKHGDLCIMDALTWMVGEPHQLGDPEAEPDELNPKTLAWRMKLHEDRQREEQEEWY